MRLSKWDRQLIRRITGVKHTHVSFVTTHQTSAARIGNVVREKTITNGNRRNLRQTVQ
jgi:hypothetical protein